MKNNAYKTLIDNISFSFKDYFHEHTIRRSIDDIFFRLAKNSPETLQKLYKEISLKHISSIRIIDKNGSSILLLNKGSPHNKKLCIRTNTLNPAKNTGALKTVIFNEIIKHDIKRALIAYYSRTGQTKPLSALMFGKNYQEKTLASSSSFENRYKSLLRTQGTYTDPLAAAASILKTMPPEDKALLSTSLQSKGIKTVQDFKGILAKWKQEVVQETPKKHLRYSYSPSLER